MTNDGRSYEQFVKRLQQALLDSEDIFKQKNILVEANKRLVDGCGVKREFDLYWEYELGGIIYKTVIECKDYSSPVSIEKIDALIGKTHDLPELKAVFATKTGYQSGAKTKALKNNVDLLVVREQCDEDWYDSDGTPYLKTIDINIVAKSAARTTSFRPVIDGNWMKENTDIDISKPLNFSNRNDKVMIEDIANGDTYSILQLEGRLSAEHFDEYGTFTKVKEFEDAYIYIDGMKMRLKLFTIEYVIATPISLPILIDYSKELLGVIEYLGRGSKTAVFKDKIVKDW